MFRFLLSAIFTIQLLGSPAMAQESQQSDYVFRYTEPLSALFIESMTFPETESLDLGECTATLNINGPLACTVNCDDASVCLLAFTGPPGLESSDLLEKLEEVPVGSLNGGSRELKAEHFRRN